MGRVRYSRGVTVNTGNFNSVRIDMSHEVECTDDDYERQMDKAKAFVDERMKQELVDVKRYDR